MEQSVGVEHRDAPFEKKSCYPQCCSSQHRNAPAGMRLPLVPSVRKWRPFHVHKLNDVMARFIDVAGLVVREESGLYGLVEFVLVLPPPRTQVTADHHVKEKIRKGKPVPRSLQRRFQIGVPHDDALMQCIPEAQQSVALPGKGEHYSSHCPGFVNKHPFTQGQPDCPSLWGPRLLEYGSSWDIGREDIWPIMDDEHGAGNPDFASPDTLAHNRFPSSPRRSHDRFTFPSVHFCHPRSPPVCRILSRCSCHGCTSCSSSAILTTALTRGIKNGSCIGA